MNPLAGLTNAQLVEECGAVLGYCEHCGGPIFEGDEPESYTAAVAPGIDDHVFVHRRCAGQEHDPKHGFRTNDLSQHLFDLGADLARVAAAQARGGAA